MSATMAEAKLPWIQKKFHEAVIRKKKSGNANSAIVSPIVPVL